MADLQLLEKLCVLHGISGREEEVRSAILEEIRPYVQKVEITPLGNIVAEKKGANRPKVRLMLNAHMDEVGMIVTSITKDGFLKFANVGGIDRRVLCGRQVLVNGKYPGVIGAKPIHMLEKDERGKSVPLNELSIDIGAKDKEEAEKFVSVGDSVTFISVMDTSRNMVRGRALDDRAGCAVLIDMIKSDLPYDCTFVFAVQEEIGLRGSRTAAYKVQPDAAIVVESTTAADIAGVDEEKQVCHVGKGPVISFMDRATIYDKKYVKATFETANENNIPCQSKQAVAGGNDAGAIHVSRSGVRTLAVSLPCRYLHSAQGMISQEDYHNAERLICVMAEKIAAGELD